MRFRIIENQGSFYPQVLRAHGAWDFLPEEDSPSELVTEGGITMQQSPGYLVFKTRDGALTALQEHKPPETEFYDVVLEGFKDTADEGLFITELGV